MGSRTRQLDLELTTPVRWGGARPGAGRKPGLVRRDPHRKRAPLAARHPCHVTWKVVADVASLRSARLVAELERSWREARERRGFRLVHYSVQGNHVHAIVEAASAQALACGMKSIAARFARGVNRIFQRAGRVLADRSHVHVLRSPREVRHAIAYVLLNARRHAAKLGRPRPGSGPGRENARVDPASSGRWFSGWRSPLPAPRDAPAVAAARTWLLAIGWRRCGRIDPSEIPGVRGGRRAGRPR